jgi:hypothetical protein
VPALLSSLIKAPAGGLAGALAAGDSSRDCVREWLARVPDHRSVMGRWHPLEFVVALAICAFTAAGHDSPAAVAEWAAGCSQHTLAVLGGRRDPWAQRIRAPSARTFARVFTGLDAEAFNAALYGYLGSLPASPADALPAVTRREREQRRAAKARPEPPGLLDQAAADGKTVRGAFRPDGSQVHLLSVFDVATGCVRAQREIDAKTNEIPELAPAVAHLDLTGTVVTLDALHTQAETTRYLAGDKHAHYLMIVKGNQPTLLETVTQALTGPDSDFAEATWTEEGTGHGRRERRAIRAAPAGVSPGRTPPRSSASAATAAPPTAPGRTRRSPSASPACPPRWPAPGTWPPTPVTTGRSRTASITCETIRRGPPAGPHREPARCLRRHPQPGHRRFPPRRIRQHRPRPPLLRPRRPAHPRPLRIRMNQTSRTVGQITQTRRCRGG